MQGASGRSAAAPTVPEKAKATVCLTATIEYDGDH